MPASSARLSVRFLRPWIPAENDPAEPNALTQSLQLICSLMPSSTVPSTRLVIIWLKRCLATSLIEPALESEPVGPGGQGGSAAAPEGWLAGLLRLEPRLVEVGDDEDVEVEVDVDVEVDVEVDVDVDVEVEVEVDVDVEHEVGVDC